MTIPETGGGTTETALAAEVLHIRIGSDPVTPWAGRSPLSRASLTAGLLHVLEDALSDVYESAPLGSQITPMPENPEVNNERLGASFRGKRGRVLLRRVFGRTGHRLCCRQLEVTWWGAESVAACPEGLDHQSIDDLLAFVSRQGFNAVRLPFLHQHVLFDEPLKATAFSKKLNAALAPDGQPVSYTEMLLAVAQRGAGVPKQLRPGRRVRPQPLVPHDRPPPRLHPHQR